MGSLRVNQISANNRTSILWQKQGDQGPAWNQAYVDLVNSDANTKVSKVLLFFVCMYFSDYVLSLNL